MRSPTPRQWTAIAIATAALPALALTAWPLAPFLANLAPETLPLSRILWGLFFAATLLASAILARSGAHGSVLWLGWLIISAWVVAIAAVGGIVLVVWLVLGSPSLGELPRLSPNQLDAIATRAFAVVAGLGGVALLMIAYRRQRTAENGEQREITKLFTERFTTASEQLGSQHAAVRLAGVHALAHLADDAPEGREDLAQMVIDVLCAYLRMPYSPAPKALPKNASKARREEHRERELECASFRQVRHTIIRVIGNHLREPTRWRGKDYDFTGVAFDGGDLSQAHFGGGHVSFKAARFAEGEVSFIGAQFTNGLVSFAEAEFTGGTVSFALAQFSGGEVAFARAQFTSGLVDFSGTEFTGGRVTLHRAQFSGGTVSFQGARLHNDAVSFYEAVFTGGEVSFFGARLSGGEISFAGVRLSEGRVSFEETQFTGSEVSF
ncbi:pentapeptide repeat-containing protein, partial [Nocardiopsis sp. NPDC006938]|uniref:pentapeptide repeat-containing protein n=1 Tax=Nocardiopsis sp. NPDC006938 TaxID=3364337 RepID=UPI00368D2F42